MAIEDALKMLRDINGGQPANPYTRNLTQQLANQASAAQRVSNSQLAMNQLKDLSGFKPTPAPTQAVPNAGVFNQLFQAPAGSPMPAGGAPPGSPPSVTPTTSGGFGGAARGALGSGRGLLSKGAGFAKTALPYWLVGAAGSELTKQLAMTDLNLGPIVSAKEFVLNQPAKAAGFQGHNDLVNQDSVNQALIEATSGPKDSWQISPEDYKTIYSTFKAGYANAKNDDERRLVAQTAIDAIAAAKQAKAAAGPTAQTETAAIDDAAYLQALDQFLRPYNDQQTAQVQAQQQLIGSMGQNLDPQTKALMDLQSQMLGTNTANTQQAFARLFASMPTARALEEQAAARQLEAEIQKEILKQQAVGATANPFQLTPGG